jgi:ElaB/YqjD/DUF883 family membrane-anchored ribosome-binding protein
MNESTSTALGSNAGQNVEQAAALAASKAEEALRNTQRVSNGALDHLQGRVHELGQTVPGALGNAVSHAEELARRGLEKARQASAEVREQVSRGGERSVAYIRDEPVKSVLLAVVAGAALAVIAGWASRSRSH